MGEEVALAAKLVNLAVLGEISCSWMILSLTAPMWWIAT